jgi:cyclopropane fatty-acyl-phospholipid synthase-like methyltransferase
MINDLVKKGYNQAAEDYSSKRNQFENTKYLEKLNSLLAPSSKILDIGCGPGLPVDKYFVEHGHSVKGIDISEKMIELAKKNVAEAEYEIEDMSTLKKREYKVDAVISFYAIFHISREKHTHLLQRINTFLPKGGLLLITMGSTDWEGHEPFHGVEMHWSHYDAKKNSQLVQKAGFELLIDVIDHAGNERHQVILGRKI